MDLKATHMNILQYFYLENPLDRGAWQATVHEVARVRHDLATKPPHVNIICAILIMLECMVHWH